MDWSIYWYFGIFVILLLISIRKWTEQHKGLRGEGIIKQLVPLTKGTVAGRPYVAVAETDGTISAYVTLSHPLEFELHLHGHKGPWFHGSVEGLSRVDLEGDFPSYFRVYCTPGYESRTLELLDPADMAYLVDFCRNYDVTFNHESMVLTQPPDAPHDPTSVITDAEQLLTRNRIFFDNL